MRETTLGGVTMRKNFLFEIFVTKNTKHVERTYCYGFREIIVVLNPNNDLLFFTSCLIEKLLLLLN